MRRDSNTIGSRRSFVLLAVLVVMMSAMLVATSLLFVAQTEAAGAAGGADAAQSRALLWSGAQAVVANLQDQRDRVLAGESPSVDAQLVIYETESRAGVVRLLPIGPDGESLASEAGKVDLNRATADDLARTGLTDAALAAAIIAWRDRLGRPVQSINELLNVPGVTIETLYGSIAPLQATTAAMSPVDDRRLGATRASAAPVRGLADALTVFSVEPAVQSTGRLRIDLNVPWSEELGRKVEDRFGPDAAALLKQVYDGGTKFESDASIVKAMRAYKTPIEDWPAILDAFTTKPDPLRYGRLDINTASREALMSLPGVTAEQAAQLVSVRSELSPVERGSIAWPVLNQIVTPEAFEAITDRITVRCWTYRLRIAAGEVNADDVDGPLTNPQIQELVIDLADAKPRIAYLRDITMLQDASLIASQAVRERADDAVGLDAPVEAGSESPPRPRSASPATRPGRSRVRPPSTATEPATSQPAQQDGRRIGRWTGV